MLLNAVLLSWLEDVDTDSRFLEKYENFKKLEKLIKDSGLFNKINKIDNNLENNRNIAIACIKIYKNLITNPNYIKYSKKCGYHLSEDFINSEKYFESELIKKVAFFNRFSKELDKIKQRTEKGVLINVAKKI